MTSVAVIGTGFMGENHARGVSEHPMLSLEYVVDIDRERAEEMAQRYGGTPVTDRERALEKVDGAIVATPPPTHADIAEDVLGAGVHLLLEKPIAERLDAADQLVESAARADVVTGVGFILRYDPPHATIRLRVENGDLGQIAGARVKRSIPVDPEGESTAQLHGHPVLYMNVHDIDMLHYCLDADVEHVTAVECRRDDADTDIPDATQALLTYDSGATAVLEGYSVLPGNHPDEITASFELTGTEGVASVTTPGDTVALHTDRYERPDTRFWPVVNGRMQGTVRMQLDRFADAINGRAEMVATMEDGYRAHVVADAIRRSIERDERVSVEY